MELTIRAVFCLTRGLMPGVTDRMKVSFQGFGTMMFYSSAVPAQAQPFSTSQLFPSWQCHLQDTSNLYKIPHSLGHLWVGDRSQPWI